MPEYYFQRGLVKDALGKVNDAMEDYSFSIDLDTTFAEAYIARANLFEERGITRCTERLHFGLFY